MNAPEDRGHPVARKTANVLRELLGTYEQMSRDGAHPWTGYVLKAIECCEELDTLTRHAWAACDEYDTLCEAARDVVNAYSGKQAHPTIDALAALLPPRE